MGPIFPPPEPELENLPPLISSCSIENTDQDPPPPSPTLESFDNEDQEEILDLPPPGDDEGSDPPLTLNPKYLLLEMTKLTLPSLWRV